MTSPFQVSQGKQPAVTARAVTLGDGPWLITPAVMLATFMEVLDTTVVNVSLTHIAGSLAATISGATWELTSYLVANGVVIPISGWLGLAFVALFHGFHPQRKNGECHRSLQHVAEQRWGGRVCRSEQTIELTNGR